MGERHPRIDGTLSFSPPIKSLAISPYPPKFRNIGALRYATTDVVSGLVNLRTRE